MSDSSIRVLLDAHMVGEQETGNETYILNLVRQQSQLLALGFEIRALVKPYVRLEQDISEIALRMTSNSDFKRFIEIPRATQRIQAKGYHVTYHGPFWDNLPYVVTIHDVSYRQRPFYHSLRNIVLQNFFGFFTAARAKAIVTDSEFSKKEIERVYPFAYGKIFVMLGGAAASFYPRSNDYASQVVKNLGVRPPYLFWAGAFQTRKNVLRLVEAFLRHHSSSDSPVQLVLAANTNTKLARRLRRVFANEVNSNKIVMVGYIDDPNVLACLYSGCEAFVFPSLYEGFGLPVLEAMQCGAPVITSNVTALPEVAGDAALLVDPTDPEAIAQAIRRVLTDPDLRAELRARGLRRAQQFSWARTAQLTAEAYRFAFDGEKSR